MKHITLIFSLFFLIISACNEKPIRTTDTELLSPDSKNRIIFHLKDGIPSYSVFKDDTEIISSSALGFELKNLPDLKDNFQVIELLRRTENETWQPVWGQQSEMTNHYNELTVRLQQGDSLKRELNLIFRAYNDGVAFRYEFPEQPELTEFNITNELTAFAFATDIEAWWQEGDFDSYEKLYNNTPLSEMTMANTPVTFRFSDGVFLSIHEAALTDYAGMCLKKQPNALQLNCELVPWPDSVKVKTAAPRTTPWRTVQLSETAGGLIESSLILNLNEPNVLEDVSWIRPMKYMGIWWEIHLNEKTWIQGPRHGATTERAKEYIDFASENGIDAILAEGWNTGWEQWGESRAFDQMTPYPDFDMEAVVNYGKEKGVEFMAHHETGGDAQYYEEVAPLAFASMEQMGISALKTGYAGGIHPRGQHHHGQFMVNHYRKIVELAAKHRIMLNAHEPIKPTGISRTYPNMMTREGVRGMEWNAWSKGNPPSHTLILPFTRMLAGPLDYTPGTFDVLFDNSPSEAAGWSELSKDDLRVHTTRAKQLALFIVLYSPLQMASDKVENYRNQPAFELIRRCPTTWDQTIVPQADIGRYLTIARRSGSQWFVASITNEDARKLELPLTFLNANTTYTAIVFADAEGTDWQSNPAEVRIDTLQVISKDTLPLHLPAGGGQTIILSPQK